MNIQSAQDATSGFKNDDQPAMKESRHNEMEKKGLEEWEKSSNITDFDRPHEHSKQFQEFERQRENTKKPVIAYGDGGDFNELAKMSDNPATGVKLSGEAEFGTKRSDFFGGEPSSDQSGGKDRKYQRHENEPRYMPRGDETLSDDAKETLSHAKEAVKEKAASWGSDDSQAHQHSFEEHKNEAKEHGESFLQTAMDVASGAAQSVKDAALNVFQKTADVLGISSQPSSDRDSDVTESNKSQDWTTGPEGTTLGGPSSQTGSTKGSQGDSYRYSGANFSQSESFGGSTGKTDQMPPSAFSISSGGPSTVNHSE